MDLLKSLEYFEKAVACGSFSAASQCLGLSAAAVRKQVGELEKTLGVVLFERGARGLVLTPVGKQLLAQTQAPAHALRRIAGNLADSVAPVAGTLRANLPQEFAQQVLVPALSPWLLRYPEMELDWSFGSCSVDWSRDALDVVVGADVNVGPGMVARPVLSLREVCVAAPAYLMRQGVPRSLGELEAHDCIRQRCPATGRVREWCFEVQGDRLASDVRGHLVLDDAQAVCEFALAGLGLARLQAYHTLPHLDAGRLVQVLPEYKAPQTSLCVCWAQKTPTPPKIQAFVDFLQETVHASGLRQRLLEF